MCVDCVLALLRITQVDPGDEPIPEVVLSHIPYNRIGVCLIIYTVPCVRINRVQWEPVWQLLLDPLKVNSFDQVEDPRQRRR
jgi:hypothetical protein